MIKKYILIYFKQKLKNKIKQKKLNVSFYIMKQHINTKQKSKIQNLKKFISITKNFYFIYKI